MAVVVFALTADLLASATGSTSTRLPSVPEITFQQLNGGPVPLSNLRGTVVLLNFWGTWCAPCLKEIPELIRLSLAFRANGLEVVGIALESGQPDDIRAFMTEHGMAYAVLIGDMACVKERFRVMGFPMSVLIDRQGFIRKRYFGPQTEKGFARDVAPLLQ